MWYFGGRLFITNYKILKQTNLQSTILCCKQWKHYMHKTFLRQMGHKNVKDKEPFVPFLEMMNNRRAEAKRSIIVQVQSAKSCNELHSYCSTIGEIKSMYHYSVGNDKSHFIIVEFTDEATVKEVLLKSSHLEDSQTIPIHSNFLWFKLSGRKNKLKQAEDINLSVENGNAVMGDKELKTILHSCESVSDQIIALHNATTLNDVATRLRFLTARQIELCVSGMFPKAAAYPFGSSVNGFGKMGCDLDAILQLSGNEMAQDDSRLVFHCKSLNGYEKSISLRHLEVIGDLLQIYLPGCTQIRKILQARVPIVKYYQQMTDIECDLSMNNMSGVCMSDMLYLFGSIDPRVRPLVFTIRRWAKEVGLTNNSPGRWITNFSLTLLVLAFLQKPIASPPILPSLNLLVKSAEAKDKFITDEGVNCTFLRDIKNITFRNQNTDTLELLLQQFCEHYSNFNFQSKAVCLNEGIAITKPDHSPMYIVNPLERGLNVSKNVSLEEVEKFKFELRNAAWLLEEQDRNHTKWGILDIFDTSKKKSIVIPSKQARLMDVTRIFSDDEAVTVQHTASVTKRKTR